jgi:hypothetical protein
MIARGAEMTKTSTIETRAPWWTIPQALIWIVTRSESQVLRATGARSLANIAYVTGLRPVSDPRKPPVSAAAAPDELQQAWTAGRITIFGREWGRGPSRSVSNCSDLRIQDHRAEVCIGNSSLYRGTSRFWSGLCVRVDDCKALLACALRAGGADLSITDRRKHSFGQRCAGVLRREAQIAPSRTKESWP